MTPITISNHTLLLTPFCHTKQDPIFKDLTSESENEQAAVTPIKCSIALEKILKTGVDLASSHKQQQQHATEPNKTNVQDSAKLKKKPAKLNKTRNARVQSGQTIVEKTTGVDLHLIGEKLVSSQKQQQQHAAEPNKTNAENDTTLKIKSAKLNKTWSDRVQNGREIKKSDEKRKK